MAQPLTSLIVVERESSWFSDFSHSNWNFLTVAPSLIISIFRATENVEVTAPELYD